MIKLTTKATKVVQLLKEKPDLWSDYQYSHSKNLVKLYESLHILALQVDARLEYGPDEKVGPTLLMAMNREREIHKEYRHREREFIKEHSDDE